MKEVTTMANQPVNRGIKNGWSLMNFGRAHGNMQVGEFTNQQSGDTFKSCIFTNPNTGDRCYVAFSSKLGELTPAQIKAQMADLNVVELEPDENGKTHYTLCKAGNNAWQDVDIDFGF